jgi:predicted RNA binding protein YcfA (HicA-like mRNA interferase family)
LKLPRSLSGDSLAAALGQFGYQVTRQTGSHLRLTTDRRGEHHVTIPRHSTLKAGTLSGILSDVAQHLGMEKAALIGKLFD